MNTIFQNYLYIFVKNELIKTIMKNGFTYLSMFLIFFLSERTLKAQEISFTADQPSGCAPLVVEFSNSSTIDTNGVSFYWCINWGEWKKAYDTSFTFVNTGNNFVELRAFSSIGEIGYHSMYINVSGTSANFYANTGWNICPGQQVYFWSNDPYENMRWDFGTGDTANWNWSPCTYNSPGDYTVQLIQTTPECGTDTVEKIIHVSSDAIPTVIIQSNGGQTFCSGDNIQFSDQYPASSYLWNFGDGFYSAQSQPMHQFAETGNYQVVLIAENLCGNSNTDTIQISISDQQPAWAGFNISNYQPCPGQSVQFYSWTPGSLLWDFNDGATSTDMYPIHTFADTGNYSIQLIVTNGCGGSDTMIQNIHVQYQIHDYYNNYIYFDNFENWSDDQPVDTLTFCPGTSVMFRDNSSAGESYYLWNFGDGTTSTEQNPVHVFNTPGFLTVSLISYTNCGDSDTAFKYMNVDAGIQPDLSLQNFPETICPNEKVFFWAEENNHDNNNNNEVITYSIWFGDGTSILNFTESQGSELGTLAEHVYAVPGIYNYTFTATNSCGNTFTKEGIITVSTDGNQSQNFFVNNSTMPESPDYWANFGVPPSEPYAEFVIPISFDQWESGLNNTYFIVFWEGAVTLGENMPEPIGLITQQGLDDVHAFVPASMDTVTIAGAWICNGTLGEGDPDAFAFLQPMQVVAGVVTNVPAPGLQIAGWDGVCDPSELNNPYAACPGDEVEFVAVGGLQYEWHFGDGAIAYGQMVTHAYNAIGSYDASVIISRGCGTKDTVHTPVAITDSNMPYADFSTNNWSCTGAPVNFWFQDHGGSNTESWSFEWDFGDGTSSTDEYPVHVYASPGEYYVQLTVSNGCGTASNSTTVWISGPNVTAYTGNGCASENNGFIELNVEAYQPISYQWSNSATSQNLNNLAPGSYSVTVTDNNLCQVTQTYEILNVQPLSIASEIDHISCKDATDGEINLTISGGSAPYFISWNNGASGESLTSLEPGTYDVLVLDASACNTSESFSISEPDALSVLTTVTDASCNNASDGTVNLTVTGGTQSYSFNWSNGSDAEDAVSLQAGDYTCIVTDYNNCFVMLIETVAQPDAIVVSTFSVQDASCGNAYGSAEVTATGGAGGFSYLWNDAASQTTAAAVNLLAGIYTVTVTDQSDCFATHSITIDNINAPVIDQINSSDVLCHGEASGSATVVASGGTGTLTYSWSNNVTDAANPNIPAGSYSIQVTDGLGCSVYSFVTITEPTNLIVVISAHHVSCNAGSDGWIAADASGGVNPYGFQWTGGSVNDTLFDLALGEYAVTVTDQNNCTHVDTVEITESDEFIASVEVVTPILCYGYNSGVLQAAASGGTSPYTYYWAGGETTQMLSDLDGGNMFVTVSDANNCTALANYNLVQPTLIQVNVIKQDISCFGFHNGQISLTVTGGTINYSYSWSNDSITSSVSNLNGGTYTVTVSDANNCFVVSTVSITEPQVLNVSMTSTSPYCYGDCNGFALANIQGGTLPYSFEWDDQSYGDSRFNLCAGSYTFTVTDANSCIDSAEVTISEPSLFSIALSTTDITCHGFDNGIASVTPTGGSAPYSIIWSGIATTGTIDSLPAGEYIVQVLDAFGCEIVDTVSVSEPDTFVVVFNVQDISCNGYNDGSVFYSATGGIFPYEISIDGQNWIPGDSISSLQSGEYIVIARDSNYCFVTDTFTLTQPDPIVSLILKDDVLCYGDTTGAVYIQVTGDYPPYIYNWSNNGTNDTLENLSYGNYYVTITDINNCEQFDSVAIFQPTAMNSTATGYDVLCSGDTNGLASVIVTGGTTGYQFAWSNGDTISNIFNLDPGTYFVTITDANGCILIDTSFVDEPLPLTLSANVTDASAATTTDGAIDLTVTGGVTPYDFLWDNTLTTEDISGLLTGFYDVLVVDANGCQAVDTIFVDFANSVLYAGKDDLIKIYPNPVKNLLFIKYATGATIEILDILGNSLYVIENASEQNVFDMSKKASGNYFVRITRNGVSQTRKITKQ